MGPHDRPFVTETPNDRDILIVNLTPAGAHRLLGAPMSELANRWTPLGDLAGAGANVLSDQLRDARTWDERFGRLEAFLVDRCGAGRRPRRDVSALWRRLSQGSAATVGDVARSEDLSHKHVIQLFREQVGLAPKRVARLARFNRVLRMGRGARRVDWAEVAQACGYFDQAHMINEFRDLAGATPRELEARKAAFTLRAGPAG
jgi:AraC-like DNA-binding protein